MEEGGLVIEDVADLGLRGTRLHPSVVVVDSLVRIGQRVPVETGNIRGVIGRGRH